MANLKYDMNFISSILSNWFWNTNWVYHADRFSLTYDFLVSVNAKRDSGNLFWDFLRSFEHYSLIRYQHLEILPDDIIKEMLQDNIDGCWYENCALQVEAATHYVDNETWRFFQEVLSYAKKNENSDLLHFARDVLPHYR